MFNHMDGAMQGLAKKKTPSKEDLFFAVKLARQKMDINPEDETFCTTQYKEAFLQHVENE